MKFIKYLLFVFLLLCFDSCIVYHDLRNEYRSNYDIRTYIEGDNTGYPFPMNFGIYHSNKYFSLKEHKTAQTKLCYSFKIDNMYLLKHPYITLKKFYFSNRINGKAIPCKMKIRYEINSRGEKIQSETDTFPLIIKEEDLAQSNWVTIFIETDILFSDIKTLYINYDINIGGIKLSKSNFKYKRKLCIDWLI
jgi:hypothetical protein